MGTTVLTPSPEVGESSLGGCIWLLYGGFSPLTVLTAGRSGISPLRVLTAAKSGISPLTVLTAARSGILQWMTALGLHEAGGSPREG